MLSHLQPRLYKVHPATYVLHCVASALLIATIVVVVCCRLVHAQYSILCAGAQNGMYTYNLHAHFAYL